MKARDLTIDELEAEHHNILRRWQYKDAPNRRLKEHELTRGFEYRRRCVAELVQLGLIEFHALGGFLITDAGRKERDSAVNVGMAKE